MHRNDVPAEWTADGYIRFRRSPLSLWSVRGMRSSTVVLALIVSVGDLRGQTTNTLLPPRCEVCFRIKHDLTLRTPGGPRPQPGMLRSIDVDHRGRFYVTTSSREFAPVVYDSTGLLIKLLQMDSLQYKGPTQVFVGGGDTVLVFDPDSGQVVFFSPELQYVRSQILDVLRGYVAVRLRDGRVVVSAHDLRPDRVGLPLHLFTSAGSYVGSYGSSSNVYRVDQAGKIMIAARDSTVWLVTTGAYDLELWDEGGALRRRLSRSASWFPPHNSILNPTFSCDWGTCGLCGGDGDDEDGDRDTVADAVFIDALVTAAAKRDVVSLSTLSRDPRVQLNEQRHALQVTHGCNPDWISANIQVSTDLFDQIALAISNQRTDLVVGLPFR